MVSGSWQAKAWNRRQEDCAGDIIFVFAWEAQRSCRSMFGAFGIVDRTRPIQLVASLISQLGRLLPRSMLEAALKLSTTAASPVYILCELAIFSMMVCCPNL